MSMMAGTPEQLEAINDAINGYWLDLESVVQSGGEASLQLRRPSAESGLGQFVSTPRMEPAEHARLVIRNVESCSVVDSQQIQYYRIAELLFDEKLRTIAIRTSPPLECRFRVRRLDVIFERVAH